MLESARDRFAHLLFYVLIALIGYLAYVVLSPFLTPLAWATVFAMTFNPMFKDMSPRLGPNGAALTTTLIVAVLIVAPAVMLVSVLAREVPQVVDYVQRASLEAPARIADAWEVVRLRSPIALPEDPAALLRDGVQRALTFLAPRAGGMLADAVATVGSLFVMLFSLFFLLRDGRGLGRRVRDLLPLPEHERDRLLRETRDLVIASVGAGLLVAAIQGTVGGVTFWLLGLRAPVLWGVAMAICALIPLFGSAIVWGPAAAWLLFSGEIGRGVLLIIVGALGVGTVDNVLRPILLSGRTTASGLVIFLGLLGGISAFGFIGLVLGPIVLVTAGSLLSVFTRRPEDELIRGAP